MQRYVKEFHLIVFQFETNDRRNFLTSDFFLSGIANVTTIASCGLSSIDGLRVNATKETSRESLHWRWRIPHDGSAECQPARHANEISSGFYFNPIHFSARADATRLGLPGGSFPQVDTEFIAEVKRGCHARVRRAGRGLLIARGDRKRRKSGRHFMTVSDATVSQFFLDYR